MSDAPKPAYRLLNQLVDSLHVRISRNRLPAPRYLQWRDAAVDHAERDPANEHPLYVDLDGVGTFELRLDRRHYEVKFINPVIGDIRIWRADVWDQSFATGQIYVDFRSVFLQFHGLAGARVILDRLVQLFYSDMVVDPEARLGQHDWYRVSRADLAVDVQMPHGMTDDEIDRYVTRARIVEPFSTLTDATVKELVSGVLAREKQGSPSLGNKGCDNHNERSECPAVQEWAPPAPSLFEAAAGAVLREFAEAVNDARRHDKGGAFVTRKVRRNRKVQTVYFGRFASDLYAIGYNKLASISIQDKLYMGKLWLDNGWDGKSHVWRTEFRITGKMLKRLEPAVTFISENRGMAVKIDSLQELDNFEKHIELIWEYLTCEWLRHCDIPWDDTNKTNPQRWTVSTFWRIVQSAWIKGDSLVKLKRKHWQPVDLTEEEEDNDPLMLQLQGIITSLVARRSLNDQGEVLGIDKITGEFIGGLQSVENRIVSFLRSPKLYDELKEKRLRMGIDDETSQTLSEVLAAGSLDAWESALYRRERMQEGLGS